MENTTKSNNYHKFRDNLILILSVWMMIYLLYWMIVPFIFDYFFPDLPFGSSLLYKITSPISQLAWAIVPLSLAFAVLNKNKKLIAIIIGGIYLLISLIDIIAGIYRSIYF